MEFLDFLNVYVAVMAMVLAVLMLVGPAVGCATLECPPPDYLPIALLGIGAAALLVAIVVRFFKRRISAWITFGATLAVWIGSGPFLIQVVPEVIKDRDYFFALLVLGMGYVPLAVTSILSLKYARQSQPTPDRGVSKEG